MSVILSPHRHFERVISGLTAHQQQCHTDLGPRFKVSSEKPEERGIDLVITGLVVQRVIHYTTTAAHRHSKSLSVILTRSIPKLSVDTDSVSQVFFNTIVTSV